jgi:hypothetical protein
MFGVLEIALGSHPITAAGRVATELEVFLEELLGRAANPHIRAARIKDMVPVERLVAGLPETTATSTSAAMAMATAHPLYVHPLSRFVRSCRP